MQNVLKFVQESQAQFRRTEAFCAKVKALPGDTLAELAKTDELELTYLHLQSMRNFQRVTDRAASR